MPTDLLGAVLGGGGGCQPLPPRLHGHVLQLGPACRARWKVSRELECGAAKALVPGRLHVRHGAARRSPLVVQHMLQLQLLQRGLHCGCRHGGALACLTGCRSRPPHVSWISNTVCGAVEQPCSFCKSDCSEQRSTAGCAKVAPPALRDPFLQTSRSSCPHRHSETVGRPTGLLGTKAAQPCSAARTC